MSTAVNLQAMNSAAKVLTNQARALSEQGHEEMYFTAQFWSGGRKQNGIERGGVTKISKQVRDYVRSEQADTMTVDIFEESTGKSIYRRKFSDLYKGAQQKGNEGQGPGHNGFNGFGEVEFNALVDKRVEVKEQAKDYARQTKELEELRIKYNALEEEKAEVEAALEAKKKVEYYSGILSTVLPSIAPLFQGTPLAQAAGMLAGVGEAAKAAADPIDEDVNALAEMVNDFCRTLTPQQSSAFHLLCAGLEKDRNKIFTFLTQLMAESPAANQTTKP